MFGWLFGLIPLLLLATGIYLIRRSGLRKFARMSGVVLLVLGILGTVSVSLPYGLVALKAAQCSHMPVIGSDFAASNSYSLPSDPDYYAQISIFETKTFCSESDAQAKGYHHRTIIY